VSVKSLLVGGVLRGAVAAVSRVPARAPDGDSPRAVHVAGPEPHRLLIIGNGPSIGIGVLSHELGLPGQLGRRLSSLSGRGVDLEVVARIKLGARRVGKLISNIDLHRFDALVLTIGYSESLRLTPPARWRRELEALLDRISRSAAPGFQVVMVAAKPFVPSPDFSALFTTPANEHLTLINDTARDVLRHRRDATFVDSLPEVTASFFQYTAHSYELWAEALAPELVPLLNARRDIVAPADERARQEALDELRILDTPPEERFDQYTRLAVDLLGMGGAAVTFIDRDREWVKSIAGVDAPENTPRAQTFCDITIRSPESLIIEDARADPRFRNLPTVAMRGGVRFYAGYPLEARNGYRVGAFCVIDTKPRVFTRADQTILRDLALKVQADLWELADAN